MLHILTRISNPISRNNRVGLDSQKFKLKGTNYSPRATHPFTHHSSLCTVLASAQSPLPISCIHTTYTPHRQDEMQVFIFLACNFSFLVYKMLNMSQISSDIYLTPLLYIDCRHLECHMAFTSSSILFFVIWNQVLFSLKCFNSQSIQVLRTLEKNNNTLAAVWAGGLH